MSDIKIGDIVKVFDTGCVYPSYIGFFNEQGFGDLEKYHRSYAPEDSTGTVQFYGNHNFGKPIIYAVEINDDEGGILLVGEGGIELIQSAGFVLPDITANQDSILDLLGFAGGAPCC